MNCPEAERGCRDGDGRSGRLDGGDNHSARLSRQWGNAVGGLLFSSGELRTGGDWDRTGTFLQSAPAVTVVIFIGRRKIRPCGALRVLL